MEMMNEGGSVKKKKTQGRRKIEIKKIEEQSNRHVTFCKRRAGLFKKASELCIVTGAQVAIIVHSHGKRVFSFGHPTADAVVDRYLSGADVTAVDPSAVVSNMGEYNEHYSRVSKELDVEKKRRAEANSSAAAGGLWWEENVEGKQVEELEEYVAALEELSKKVTQHADDLMVLGTSTSMPAVHNPHMEEAPPLDHDTFVNQLWSGYNFGQGQI